MSTAYYYFAASLPMLAFGQRQALSCEEFLAECQRLLSPEDFAEVQGAMSDECENVTGRYQLVRDWKRFMRSLQNEIAVWRAGQYGQDPRQGVRGERDAAPAIAAHIAEALKEATPLEIERRIDQFRWETVDALGLNHFFDIEYIIIYGIKLKILERYRTIASARGGELFDAYKEKAVAHAAQKN